MASGELQDNYCQDELAEVGVVHEEHLDGVGVHGQDKGLEWVLAVEGGGQLAAWMHGAFIHPLTNNVLRLFISAI